MAVIQMMILNRNLLRGKLCSLIFITVTGKKEERGKEIVHKVLLISSTVAHKYITYCKLFTEHSTRKRPRTRTKRRMTVIRMTVIQMISLNRNLLCGKLCSSMFLIVTSRKGERYKEIVHRMLFILSTVVYKYIANSNFLTVTSTDKTRRKGRMLRVIPRKVIPMRNLTMTKFCMSHHQNPRRTTWIYH